MFTRDERRMQIRGPAFSTSRQQCGRGTTIVRGCTGILSELLCAGGLCDTMFTFHSQQHTYMSSSYRSNRLALSNWDPYVMHRSGCLVILLEHGGVVLVGFKPDLDD